MASRLHTCQCAHRVASLSIETRQCRATPGRGSHPLYRPRSGRRSLRATLRRAPARQPPGPLAPQPGRRRRWPAPPGASRAPPPPRSRLHVSFSLSVRALDAYTAHQHVPVLPGPGAARRSAKLFCRSASSRFSWHTAGAIDPHALALAVENHAVNCLFASLSRPSARWRLAASRVSMACCSSVCRSASVSIE